MKVFWVNIFIGLFILSGNFRLMGKDSGAYNCMQIDSLISVYKQKGQFEKAYEFCMLKRDITRSDSIGESLCQDLAYLSSRLGKYDEAINWQEKAIASFTQNDSLRLEYAIALDALAKYYSRASRYDLAVKVSQNAIEIIEKIAGKQSGYAEILNNQAHYVYKIGEISRALEMAKEANDILKDECPSSLLYADNLKNLAQYYSRLGRYSEAIRISEEAESLLGELLGTNHPDYANLLSNQSTYYSRIGDYIQAVSTEQIALEIRKRILGNSHIDYATSLTHLAHYYHKLGNNKQAISYGVEANSIRLKYLDEAHVDYIEGLNDLGKYYASADSLSAALEIGKKVVELRATLNGTENIDFANSLSNLGTFYARCGEYAEALNLEQKVKAIRKEKLSATHPDYAKSLYRLSIYYLGLNDLDSAYHYGERALDIQSNALGAVHPDIVENHMHMAEVCLRLGKIEKGIDYAQRATEASVSRIKNVFQFMTLKERNELWASYRNWFEEKIPEMCDIVDRKELNSLAYDAILFSKGILLRSERDFNDFINKNGKEGLRNQYASILGIRHRIGKIYENPTPETQIDLELLEKKLYEMEKSLILECKEYGDFTKYLALKWQDVAKELKDSDIAIEFVRYSSAGGNCYKAYILRKDYEAPEVMTLFTENLVSKEDLDLLYETSAGSELIWNKLLPKLEDAKEIYFSPDGILHQIAIEYFPTHNGKGRIGDIYNLHRLTSTRELTLRHGVQSQKEALIYGGINYDSEVEEMETENLKNPRIGTTSRQVMINLLDSTIRGARGFLKYTLTETEKIDSLMKDHKRLSVFLSGNMATEESLKSMSGSGKGLLHIATHGFYWDNEEVRKLASKNRRLQFLTDTLANSMNSVEDRSMTRTGLMMAGANNILMGKDIPSSIEDGLLTAQEIANLDFQGVDMVVLSACKTGMGKITNDGVFGLQRGFKKAGANAILMSLWDVDDEATQLLMSEFYTKNLSGLSKQEALLSAQNVVRETPRFEDPKFWAAFILLDGLD